MNSWFRLYDEVVDDPKVQRLPLVLFRAWINLMCVANKHGGVLPELADVAYKLHVTELRAEAILNDLIKAELFERSNGQYVPHNWKRRQFKSDVSTERVKRFRNGDGNVSETVNETVLLQKEKVSPTPPSKRKTESETETDTEAETFRVVEADFQDLWRKHPNPKGRKEAWRHFNASVFTLEDLKAINRALEAYKAQRIAENARRKEHGTAEIPWQNGSTWFNNWRDWIPEDFEKPDEAHGHYCELCEIPHDWMCDDPEICGRCRSVGCPSFAAKRMAAKV